jgi:hypothetical protein
MMLYCTRSTPSNRTIVTKGGALPKTQKAQIERIQIVCTQFVFCAFHPLPKSCIKFHAHKILYVTSGYCDQINTRVHVIDVHAIIERV